MTGADKEKAEPPGRQHCVDQPPVEVTYDQPFDNEPDEADDDGRYDDHGDKDIGTRMNGRDGHVSAQHHEFTMGKVDDLHHAEDNRKPGADQHQRRDCVDDFHQYDGCEVHKLSS